MVADVVTPEGVRRLLELSNRDGLYTTAQLDELEAMIALPDQELLTWATKTVPVPDAVATPLLTAMLAFRP